MGSKKLKKKKVKKLEKYHKMKKLRRKRTIVPDSLKKVKCEGNFKMKNINNQLSLKENSRSCDRERNLSDVKYFSKVREDYFRYLQTVICDNCVFYDSLVTEKVLENLALELEQNALLACLQVDIYKKSMSEIIKDIKKSTEERKVHIDVKKLLPNSAKEKNLQTNNINSVASISDPEVFSKISTTVSTRMQNNLATENYFRAEELSNNPDSYLSIPDQYQEIYPRAQDDMQININGFSWHEEEADSVMPNQSDCTCNETQQTKNCVTSNTKNVITSGSLITQNNFSQVNQNDYILSIINETKKKFDPLSQSINQLQKSVEQTLIQTKELNKHKLDEQERAYIAQILEGDDSLDDRLNDSLSDNENESKENIDESNLMDRLERMRELFGLEDEESKTQLFQKKHKQTNKAIHVINHNRRPTIWKYEKYIQLHKYSIIAAEMTFEKRELNNKTFLELFGEDSDEENEMEFSSTEKYRLSCTERISSWVVKYLMPFYHEKRILGRNMFKSLGHYISDTIVDKIQYPDEWTVKYFVSKFFPPKKKYICDADILNFQIT